MEQILDLDKKIFLALNSYHDPWLDQLAMVLTSTVSWIPLYILLLYLIIKNFGKETWMVLVAVAIAIVLADQTTSTIMKPFFARLRPSHEPGLEELAHIVNHYKGGKYGFASSHAANTFSLATLMWLLLKMYRPWIGLLFIWAVGIGYTRIYLGVHYPGDILAGELVGFLSALAAYFLFLLFRNFLEKRNVSTRGG